MECWLYATRIPAISKYNVRTDPDATYADFNAHIPRSIQWKAENYNHLHEQPTVFYAVVLALAVQQLGGAERDDSAVTLAWGYVGVRYVFFGPVLCCALCCVCGSGLRVLIRMKLGRVVHSLVQAIANPVIVRLGLFLTSSLVLVGLTSKAIVACM